ncbi:MAG TPA: acetate--CoA ligase family protein [Smithella sp.]|nr:acetate--CoA ligase family protein [Smithella sp.]
MSENPLHLLMNPQSIAVAGANNNPSKMGTIQALNIVKGGYGGRFYPIHPAEKTVLGCPAYATPEDLPEAPDLAILIVPIRAVASLLEGFGKIGTKRAIVITAGFKETGAAGRDMEKKINEIADRYQMRFVGPNCMGVINSGISLNTTVLATSREPGLLGFASQSGTFLSQTLPYLNKRGIRFSKAISLGNEANINMIDALEYLGEDEQTKAIILYIEGIREGRRFLDVARNITPHKPIAALYVGGSASGARAGLSHTGAMAGPDFLYNGIFKQAGIIRVNTIEDLYYHGWTLATQPPMRGKRVGVMTNSGGPSTTISYTCDAVGLEVPRFSDGLQNEIRKHIEPHASASNPVDMTFDLSMNKLALTLPEMVMKSGEVDAVVLHGTMMTGYLKEVYPTLKDIIGNISLEDFLKYGQMDRTVANETFELPSKYKIPMLISSFFDHEDNYIKGYQDTNTPVFYSPENTARALGSLYRYKQSKERAPRKDAALPKIKKTAEEIILKALDNKQKALDEYEAKQLLACYGVPVTKEARTVKVEDALKAAKKISYPVALKACSWKIMHKSGKGLIALNVENETDLKKEFKNIQKNAGKSVPVLVQEMLSGSREFLAGMTRFAGFGPGVVFGLGGVFTEVFKDTTMRLAPVTGADALEMFEDINARKLLDKFRGMPKVKLNNLSRIIQTVGNIALLHPEIAEIDLNPIIIDGAEPVVADALIVLENKP